MTDKLKAKLEELRTLARSVSTWISQSPSVRNSYFVIDPDPDKERRKFGPYIPNIYQCEADWGCSVCWHNGRSVNEETVVVDVRAVLKELDGAVVSGVGIVKGGDVVLPFSDCC